jgi:hypothetical protein
MREQPSNTRHGRYPFISAIASAIAMVRFATRCRRRRFCAVHADAKHFFAPSDFSRLIADPDIVGLHISPKGRRQLDADPRQPPCLGGRQV